MRSILFALPLLIAACGPASGEDPSAGPGPDPVALADSSAPEATRNAVSVPDGVDVPEGMVYVPGGT
ncbi:MAG: hypothetical protein AAFQ43_09065, partial [Bacteroidota bacterium]